MAEQTPTDRISDVPLDLWSHARLWLFCSGVLLVLRGLSRDPSWVEESYVDGWGSAAASGLAMWTSGVSFSVAEIMIGLLLGATLLSLLEAVAEVGAARRGLVNAWAGGIAHVLDLVMILAVFFYVSWGVSYARAPAIERLGWQALVVEGEATPEATRELEVLARLAQDEMERAYLELRQVKDAATVTKPREGLDVNAAVDLGFVAAARDLGLSDSFSDARGQFKEPYGSELMSWAGIGGVYLPFTGEAHVNSGPPAWSRVMTVAHEKAHQRMIASEDEASFYGFLACVYSDEPALRYSAWQFARRQLRASLKRADPEAVEALDALAWPGPVRDRQAVYAYWEVYQGWIEELHRSMNDAYLKANQVEGGVLAYGRAGRLVAAYLQSEQGRRRFADARERIESGRVVPTPVGVQEAP